ncbi:MAG: LysE family translocator [Proteobacteria bacterium]|nr:LysE family translocator [Pseudomonadota bacterium]
MPHLTLFLTAALVLAITPGPGMFYVVGRTWAAGRLDGLASSLGTMLGGFVHVVACVIGVSALVMTSAAAFTVLKLCGGLYLVWLGIQTWRSASREELQMLDESRTGALRAFRQGVVVEATNPKTAAFFLAFIPQFIAVDSGHVALQFLMLGTISVLMNTAADLIAVFGASRLHERFLHRPSLFRRLRQGSGVLMASLGVGLLMGRRPV